MKLSEVKKLENKDVELTIEVKGEVFTKAVDEAFRKNSKKMKVPGFRPGKATRRQIEAIYGKGVFYEDAVNALYFEAYTEAVKEAGIDPVDSPRVALENVDEDGFVFKATVTVKPEVEIKDYKGINVTKKVYNVTAAEVKEQLERKQMQNQRVVPVERAIKEGDVAVIDFEGFADGVAFEGGKGTDYELTIGSGSFIPGFEDQLIGKVKDEDVDVNVTFPEEYHAEELKGKPAVFKVKVKDVREKQLPEIDDEFVKDISEFDTVDELKADIKKKLKEEKARTAEEEMETAIMDALLEKMSADIPSVMIESKLDNIAQDFDGKLRAQGMDLATYLKYTGMTMENFREGFKDQAEKQVKLRLALEKIVELESIVISDEDVDAEFKSIADAYKMDVEQVKSMLPATEIVADLAVGKAMELVKNQAVVTEEKVAAKKTTSTAAKKTTSSTAKKTTSTTKKTTSTTTKKTTSTAAKKTTSTAKKTTSTTAKKTTSTAKKSTSTAKKTEEK